MTIENFYDYIGVPVFSSMEKVKPALEAKILEIALDGIVGDENSVKSIDLLAKWYRWVSSPKMKRAYDRWIVHKYYNFDKR
jgi:hypothetical protein